MTPKDPTPEEPEPETLAEPIHARCHEGRWFRRARELESKLGRANRDSAQALAQRDSALDREARLRAVLEKVNEHFGREYWTTDDGDTTRPGTPEDNECPRHVGELWRIVRSALAPPDQEAGK